MPIERNINHLLLKKGMYELLALLDELKRYIENRAAADQIADLCTIVSTEAQELGNLRVIRGAQSIKKRTILPDFDYDLAEREVNAMINSLKIRVF
ncbi:hypothetical protein KY329_05745 [Candidatus Woesearchaeota archaeon]|nr:hypothetical protein [Candidatus Woesearchaeota archaeon]